MGAFSRTALIAPLAVLLILTTMFSGCSTEQARRDWDLRPRPAPGDTGLAAKPVQPTTGTIRGLVIDSQTNAPLAGATVSTQPATSVRVLDALGHYMISGVSPGDYTVTAAKKGHKEARVDVSVRPGHTTSADIALKPLAKPKKKLLYLKWGSPSTWTVKGAPLHQYEEIERWTSADYSVTTRDIDKTPITRELLSEYKVLRFNGSHYFSKRKVTAEEGEALYLWVLNGGRLFADIYGGDPVNLVKRFGVARIEAKQTARGPWPHYHGAPLTVGPVSSDVFSVKRMAAEQLDRVYLAPEHHLTVAAKFDGYPAVAHGQFDGGKVVIVFLGNWSHDATNPGNLYKATVFQHGNLEFIEQAIKYLSE